jgi:hypothetical protein
LPNDDLNHLIKGWPEEALISRYLSNLGLLEGLGATYMLNISLVAGLTGMRCAILM